MKHLEVCQKYSAERRIFLTPFSVFHLVMKHSCLSCLIYYVKFNLVPSFSSVKSRTHWNPVYIILNGQSVKLTGIRRVKSGGVSPLSDLCSAFRKVQIPKTLKRNGNTNFSAGREHYFYLTDCVLRQSAIGFSPSILLWLCRATLFVDTFSFTYA